MGFILLLDLHAPFEPDRQAAWFAVFVLEVLTVSGITILGRWCAYYPPTALDCFLRLSI